MRRFPPSRVPAPYLRLIVSTALILALFMFCATRSSAQKSVRNVMRVGSSAPLNVLAILADDIAQADLDKVSARGWTPNIDALAAKSVRFVGLANATCSPARRSFEFGRWYFDDSGTGCVLPPNGSEPPLADTSLADLVLPVAIPVLFGKWHLGTDPYGVAWERAPLAHGFADWFGTPANMQSCGGLNFNRWEFVDGAASGAVAALSFDYEPTVIEARLETWWANTTGPRVGVWCPALAHGPFHKPPAQYLPAGYPSGPVIDNREKFELEIAALDVQVGQALDLVASGWRVNGIPSSLLVVFAGDNGTPEEVPINGFANRGKTTTFEHGIRVPFLIAGGGLVPSSTGRLAHMVDVLPTVAAFYGLNPPSGLDGINLFAASRTSAVCGNEQTTDYCVRAARWKLRRVGHLADPNGVETVYDLQADPNENAGIDPTTVPNIAASLRAVLYPEIP